MPIKKRVLDPTMTAIKWTHTVRHRHFEGKLQVSGERIVQASPQLHWTVGKRFDTVREQLARDGHELEKIGK